MTGEEFLPEKGLSEKQQRPKDLIIHHYALKYQGLDKVYRFDGAISKDDRNPTSKKYNKSDLIYKTNHRFYKYRATKKFESL